LNPHFCIHHCTFVVCPLLAFSPLY
jgi:hypothetical protein